MDLGSLDDGAGFKETETLPEARLSTFVARDRKIVRDSPCSKSSPQFTEIREMGKEVSSVFTCNAIDVTQYGVKDHGREYTRVNICMELRPATNGVKYHVALCVRAVQL